MSKNATTQEITIQGVAKSSNSLQITRLGPIEMMPREPLRSEYSRGQNITKILYYSWRQLRFPRAATRALEVKAASLRRGEEQSSLRARRTRQLGAHRHICGCADVLGPRRAGLCEDSCARTLLGRRRFLSSQDTASRRWVSLLLKWWPN